jgi:hypothetical protein
VFEFRKARKVLLKKAFFLVVSKIWISRVEWSLGGCSEEKDSGSGVRSEVFVGRRKAHTADLQLPDKFLHVNSTYKFTSEPMRIHVTPFGFGV